MYLSVADFTLRSGRTHQIRKHAAIAGHHIFGDPRYGLAKHNAEVEKRYDFKGLALHSSLLAITIDGQPHTFEAPLPPNWEPFLSAVGDLVPSLPLAEMEDLPSLAPTRARPAAKPPRTRGGPRELGKCVRWNVRKGYGFVRREESDVYVHQRSLVIEFAEGGKSFRALTVGEVVEFSVAAMADGRLEAVRVTKEGGRALQGQYTPLNQPASSTPRTTRGARSRGPGTPTKSDTGLVETEPKTLPPGAYSPKSKR